MASRVSIIGPRNVRDIIALHAYVSTAQLLSIKEFRTYAARVGADDTGIETNGTATNSNAFRTNGRLAAGVNAVGALFTCGVWIACAVAVRVGAAFPEGTRLETIRGIVGVDPAMSSNIYG